jgi:hypothetical protein
LFLIVVNTVPDRAILSVDNHIRLVFSGEAFRFIDGRILAPVFGGNAFIALPSYGPATFIRHHVLVPGPISAALPGTFKVGLYQLHQNVYPGVLFVAVGHRGWFGFTEDRLFKKEFELDC